MDTKPSPPSPKTTLIIILGASEWPSSPEFQSSEAFVKAAYDFKKYLLSPQQFGLPEENLLDCFDSTKNAGEIDEEIDHFLKNRITGLKDSEASVKDVLLYFVGHGGFVGRDGDFYLAIRRTRTENLRASGIHMAALADTLRNNARNMRRLLILDCCFAAAAFRAFQAGPAQAAIKQIIDAFEVRKKREGFPSRGIALLCSSDHKTPSQILPDESSTMFSQAMLEALSVGDIRRAEQLSLRDLKELTDDRLHNLPTGNGPKPVVHSPDQSEGDVADVPFFPNPASAAKRVEQIPSPVTKMRELHFGIIGFGYWGPKIARNLDTLPNSKVTIVADVDQSRLKSLAINQPSIKTTSKIKQVMDSDIDGVIIATPVATHYPLAKEALLYNKHVLVEKPLTANVAEAEELVTIAQERQRILMVGHTYEYNPAVNELRKLIMNGDLGKIYYVETDRVNLGLIRKDINVIWDLASHDISILLYLLGKRPKQIKVQAFANLQPKIHDIAHLDLFFPSGINAHINVSWLHPLKIRRVTVIGDARMAVYDDTNLAEMLKIYNKGADILAEHVVSYRSGEITIPYIDWVDPLRLECEDFANSIRTGEQPRTHGEVGLEVVRILAKAQEILEE